MSRRSSRVKVNWLDGRESHCVCRRPIRALAGPLTHTTEVTPRSDHGFPLLYSRLETPLDALVGWLCVCVCLGGYSGRAVSARAIPRHPSYLLFGLLTRNMAPAATTITPYLAPSRASVRICGRKGAEGVHGRQSVRGVQTRTRRAASRRRRMRHQCRWKTRTRRVQAHPAASAPHAPGLSSSSLQRG